MELTAHLTMESGQYRNRNVPRSDLHDGRPALHREYYNPTRSA
ncbi:hypothetical protein ACQEVB_29895 [Pseudonocardia sp. CA-107938]